jgi:hypothetical protein
MLVLVVTAAVIILALIAMIPVLANCESATGYVVRCAFGYYGPDRAHPGANRGDLPLKDAYRYTRREARDLAAELGAKVEEVKS